MCPSLLPQLNFVEVDACIPKVVENRVAPSSSVHDRNFLKPFDSTRRVRPYFPTKMMWASAFLVLIFLPSPDWFPFSLPPPVHPSTLAACHLLFLTTVIFAFDGFF